MASFTSPQGSINHVITNCNAIQSRKHHSMFVTQKAPDFTAQAVYPDGTFKEVNLYSFFKEKKYVCLLFYPLDFTFVCPTEILAYNNAMKEFENRNVQLIGISVDSQYTHQAWRNTPKDKGGIGQINFPLVSDITKSISKSYDTLINNAVSLRGLFLIDREGIIRHMTINDLPLGRNVDETLRIIDALQFIENAGEVCPANWKRGDKGMKTTLDAVAAHLSKY